MTDYDFRTLNDKEFEVLATDLLSLRDGARYERFKPGRDSGVDGRYFKQDGSEVILQCKHWASSPLERLSRHIEKDELPKVRKLAPRRYVLVVSHSLSRADKAHLAASLNPYVVSQSDIVGREDLNDLLAANSAVELRHYKLWINSSNVLQHLLNKPIQDRSAFLMREIQESARLYVPTENHELALRKLEDLGSVIITGPAGIGKTTLAEHLALHYFARGFSFVQISEEIREAEAVYQEGVSQLFYFDDFLGRNYLEALTGHEGGHIVQFIRRIFRDKSKRFILTSRTTILNQGKVLIDVLHNSNLERNEFEVSFDSFSEMDKAQVLYNHIWHSELAREYVDELYAQRRYRTVIAHRNFNPRLIRFITDSARLEHLSASEYWPYVHALLENPASVWENPFVAQHDDFGRAAILLVTLNARPIGQEELAEAYARFIAHRDSTGMTGRRDFLQTLRHLVGSMLNRTMEDRGLTYLNLFNPSIGDYVVHRYASDLPSLRAGFCSLRSVSSLRNLLDLRRNGLVGQNAFATILSAIVQTARDCDFVGYSTQYIAIALLEHRDFISSGAAVGGMIGDAANFVIRGECPGSFAEVADVVKRCFAESTASEQDVIKFVLAACEQGANSAELSKLSAVVDLLPKTTAESLWPHLTELAENYLSDALHSEFEDDEVFSDMDPYRPEDAEERLAQLIETRMERFGIPCSDSMVENLVEAFDVSSRMEEYFSPEPEYDRHEQPLAALHFDAIDDLFERPF